MVKRLFDDIPERSGIVEVAPKRVALVPARLLCRRGGKVEELLLEFSDKVWDAIGTKYPDHCRVVVLSAEPEWDWMATKMQSISAPDVTFFRVPPKNGVETTRKLRLLLETLGVHFLTSWEDRTMSYLNVEKFVSEASLVWLPEDYAKLGIEPDKEATFEDMVKQRQEHGWP